MSADSILRLSRRDLFAAAGGTLVLAGCAGGGAQVKIYVLRPDLPNNPAGPKVKWELAVATPYAPASLNIERIALTRSTTMLDYFADSAWTDRLPTILQNCLVESFEASGRIAAVSRDTAGLKADYILETEVRDFAAHYETGGTTPDVVVRITAKLVAVPERTIVGTLDSLQHAQAAANSVEAVVSAFNVALTASLRQIVDWTLSAPPSDLTGPPGPAIVPAHRHRRRRRRVSRA